MSKIEDLFIEIDGGSSVLERFLKVQDLDEFVVPLQITFENKEFKYARISYLNEESLIEKKNNGGFDIYSLNKIKKIEFVKIVEI